MSLCPNSSSPTEAAQRLAAPHPKTAAVASNEQQTAAAMRCSGHSNPIDLTGIDMTMPGRMITKKKCKQRKDRKD